MTLRHGSRGKQPRAFSLIEVLVAVALFGVGIASIFQSFSTATRIARHERLTASALHACEQVMEDMLLRRIDDPAFDGTLHCFDAAAQKMDCFENPAYEVEVHVSPTSIVGLYDLSALALWKEGGTPHHLALSTRRY